MIRLTIYSGADVVGVKALLYWIAFSIVLLLFSYSNFYWAYTAIPQNIGMPFFIYIGVPNFYIREAFYLIG